jgi:transposase
MMEVIIERCAGLDVHQATVVACVLIGQAGRKPHKEIRTFSTMTRDLEALRDWLKGHGVTHVGMESTGIYWKPVHGVLEGQFELIVANAHHIKTVPGQGCRVDRRPGASRPDQAELRATAANP